MFCELQSLMLRVIKHYSVVRQAVSVFLPVDKWLRDMWTMNGGSWHCTGDRDQDHSQEKEMQKSKMAVWGVLTNRCEKKGSEKQRRRGKTHPFEYVDLKNSKER